MSPLGNRSGKLRILLTSLVALLVLTVALIVMAGNAGSKPPATDPDMRSAKIVGAERLDDGWSLQLEVDPGNVTSGSYDAASVRVDAKTKLFRPSEDGYERVEMETVVLADMLDVWFTGPVAESYPVQATAGTIVVYR